MFTVFLSPSFYHFSCQKVLGKDVLPLCCWDCLVFHEWDSRVESGARLVGAGGGAQLLPCGWASRPHGTLISQVLLRYQILCFLTQQESMCAPSLQPASSSRLQFFLEEVCGMQIKRNSESPLYTTGQLHFQHEPCFSIFYLSWWVERNFVLELLVQIRFLCSWPMYLPYNYVNHSFF